jgi:hypothetical protein
MSLLIQNFVDLSLNLGQAGRHRNFTQVLVPQPRFGAPALIVSLRDQDKQGRALQKGQRRGSVRRSI